MSIGGCNRGGGGQVYQVYVGIGGCNDPQPMILGSVDKKMVGDLVFTNAFLLVRHTSH